MPETAPALTYLPQLPRDRSIGIGCIGAGFIMTDCHLVAYRQGGRVWSVFAKARWMFKPRFIHGIDCEDVAERRPA
jgi:hypothetical protein